MACAWRFSRPWMRWASPALLPLFEVLVLLLNGVEFSPLQSRVLGVLNRMLDGAFAVGVAHARRVGYARVPVFQRAIPSSMPRNCLTRGVGSWHTQNFQGLQPGRCSMHFLVWITAADV